MVGVPRGNCILGWVVCWFLCLFLLVDDGTIFLNVVWVLLIIVATGILPAAI